MKFTKGFKLVAMMVLMAIIAILAAILLPTQVANAQPQVAPYQVTTLSSATNLPAVVTTGATSNTISIIPVPQKYGMSLDWRFNVSSGTSAGVLQITPSRDGTNFDATPWQLARNANGTTDVTATTNWYKGQLAGYRALKISGMTNASGGTLTNKGVGIGVENP